MRHIHLDPLGGIAGDMFVAAILDAFPGLADGAIAAAEALASVTCRLVPHRDHVLAGSRFAVEEHGNIQAPGHHHHGHGNHTHWNDIRAVIAASDLSAAVIAQAIGIFSGLADAEGHIHGVPPDRVAFHEVGAADSIADIVAAAWLIDALGPASWSVAPLPLGSGTIETAHGRLPVPAPATARLLRGLAVIDDGVPGERVTPTGAAILHHLAPGRLPPGLHMGTSGHGFGTRTLPGLSNCLRVLAFDRAAAAGAPGAPVPHRTLLVVNFEVDDQSPEDLAAGLDRLRAMDAVHDVLTVAAMGKKGRMTIQVQVLASPDAEAAVVDACFAQTTTIGLRTHLVAARALPRRMVEVAPQGGVVRVKTVDRPGGSTAKAEADDVACGETHAARVRLRRQAEAAAQ